MPDDMKPYQTGQDTDGTCKPPLTRAEQDDVIRERVEGMDEADYRRFCRVFDDTTDILETLGVAPANSPASSDGSPADSGEGVGDA